jgi:phosphoribosyl 1,2-cyclic phosphodiesterase
MPRVYPLFSSSKGNCIYIGSRNSGILIDCGVSYSRLKRALWDNSIDASAIKAVFVTHEHDDHIKGLEVLSKALNVPIYAAEYTAGALERKGIRGVSGLSALTEADGMLIEYFDTPHDTAESVGYKINFADGKTCAVCTDLGHVSEDVRAGLTGVNLVLIESNYDEYMLKNGSYPYFLKRRIASKTGHLSNSDCAEFAAYLVGAGTTRLILGHLSEKNNTPEAAEISAVNGLSGFKRNADYILTVAPAVNNGCYMAL